MAYNIDVPIRQRSTLNIPLNDGGALFVLGANGSGKSHLMHHIYRSHSSSAIRITAHRQNWLHSSVVELTPIGRQHAERNYRGQDSGISAVWTDHDPNGRTQVALYDLIDAENRRARRAMKALDEKNDDEARRIADTSKPPMLELNEILRLATLPITLHANLDGRINARKADGAPYEINRLSDGERNALMIAATVLTAEPGRLFLIDEPERHLHRSIISPLLNHLFKKRPDCTFVVSTHDVMLALDNAGSQILLVRSCHFAGDTPAWWDVASVKKPSEIDDEFKRDILGARQQVLFVEGKPRSLDTRLYSLLFNGVTVVPKETGSDVIHAVRSTRSTKDFHWVRAYGLIDRDHRTSDDVGKLRADGIHAVPAYAVESIYYRPEMQDTVAERKSSTEGGDAKADLATAKDAAIKALKQKADYLCQHRTSMAIRHEVLKALPKKNEIGSSLFRIEIDLGDRLNAERKIFDDLIAKEELTSLLSRYPVRESPVLAAIAKALRFQSTEQYEEAVLKALVDEPGLLATTKALYQSLVNDITTNGTVPRPLSATNYAEACIPAV